MFVLFPPPSHTSETESSDSRVTRKRPYTRDFLLGLQFMPACLQKPEGLPPITGVILDKPLDSQNKLPWRRVPETQRVMPRRQDPTPAFADRQMRPPPRKIIRNVVVEDVQLKKAANAWKPGLPVKREGPVDDPETLNTQVLLNSILSVGLCVSVSLL